MGKYVLRRKCSENSGKRRNDEANLFCQSNADGLAWVQKASRFGRILGRRPDLGEIQKNVQIWEPPIQNSLSSGVSARRPVFQWPDLTIGGGWVGRSGLYQRANLPQ